MYPMFFYDEVLPTMKKIAHYPHHSTSIYVNQPHLGSKRPAALNPLSFAPEASGYASLDCPSPESEDSEEAPVGHRSPKRSAWGVVFRAHVVNIASPSHHHVDGLYKPSPNARFMAWALPHYPMINIDVEYPPEDFCHTYKASIVFKLLN